MTPPPPTRKKHQPGRIEDTLHGSAEQQGPLVRQPAPAARLARILHHSATDLWDVCTHTDSAQMWEEARAIASRILSSAPGD